MLVDIEVVRLQSFVRRRGGNTNGGQMLENDPAGTQFSLFTVFTATGAHSQLGERNLRVHLSTVSLVVRPPPSGRLNVETKTADGCCWRDCVNADRVSVVFISSKPCRERLPALLAWRNQYKDRLMAYRLTV